MNQQGLDINIDVETSDVTLHILEPELFRHALNQVITTDLLWKTYHANMAFEQPDGQAYRLDWDFFGHKRPESHLTPGPFEYNKAVKDYTI